ncbi:MAG TPA: DUF5665 domain-containing protein [Patescibacteria group bacterium]|nr:DUF5665 domain-containing protein [Patescibacteria group bacterium]
MPEETGITEERGHTRIAMPTHKIIVNNFVGGVAWGFGTVVGASVVVGIILWAASQVGIFEAVNNFTTSFQESIDSLRNIR